jgi:hypothetical protein
MKVLTNKLKLIILFGILILNSCARKSDDSRHKHPKLVKESRSRDAFYLAEIRSDMDSENYCLVITQIKKSNICIFDSIICNHGYHAPIFDLDWKKSKNELMLTIDSDFGENNQTYKFDPRTKELTKIK